MNQERPLIQNRPGPEDRGAAAPPEHEHGGYQQPAHGQPQPQPAPSRRSKWLIPALVLLALLIVAAAVWFFALREGGTDEAADASGASDETPEVVVIDESEVDVVQNPSLSATATADGVRVENDGNVTMHDIKVTEGEAEVCAIETLAPGEGSDCAGASSGATVTGLGPQDQPVEITVG